MTDHGSQYTIGAPNLPRDKGGAKPENGQNRQKAGSMLRRATRRNVRIDAGNDALDPRSRLDTEWRPASLRWPPAWVLMAQMPDDDLGLIYGGKRRRVVLHDTDEINFVRRVAEVLRARRRAGMRRAA